MIEKILEILNFQETWDSITLQLETMFDPENSVIFGAIKFLFDKIAENPLASIITLIALVGLPYTLLKAKHSDTEAKERLDELMSEMHDFEFDKPLIDLQEKFKDGSFENSPVINYDQDILELNFDKVESAFGNEEAPDIQDIESTSFVKQITLDQELTDDFLSSGSIDLISNTNEESLDLSSLSEEFFSENEISSTVKTDNVEKEPASFFVDYVEDIEIGEISNQEQEPLELTPIEEEFSNTLETSLPVDSMIEQEENAQEVNIHEEPTLELEKTVQEEIVIEEEVTAQEEKPVGPVKIAVPVIEEEVTAQEEKPVEPVKVAVPVIEEEVMAQEEKPVEPIKIAVPVADDLKSRMEQAIQKLKMNYAPQEENNEAEDAQEIDQKQIPVAINSVKKPATPEETDVGDLDSDTTKPPTESTPADSQNTVQGNSLKKSHVITHLNSFKNNFEKQLDMSEEELKKKANDTRKDQSTFFKTVQKSLAPAHPKEKTTTDEEYQKSLESFLFLKNQDKSN